MIYISDNTDFFSVLPNKPGLNHLCLSTTLQCFLNIESPLVVFFKIYNKPKPAKALYQQTKTAKYCIINVMEQNILPDNMNITILIDPKR